MKITLLSFKFEINIFSLIAFLTGILAGFVLLGLIYVFGCLKSLRKKEIKINRLMKDITEDDIKNTINKYQESFLDEKKRRKAIPIDYFKNSIFEMINEIASKFYPKSKRPIMELSIDEIIKLNRYITNKIDELFSHKGLSLFRGLKLSTIANLVQTKQNIDNTALLKTVKRYRLKKIGSFLLSAINIINPYFWVKKLVINPSINIIINKICLLCYAIAGEETYKVYSKQVFVEEDSALQEIIASITSNSKKVVDEGIIIENK